MNDKTMEWLINELSKDSRSDLNNKLHISSEQWTIQAIKIRLIMTKTTFRSNKEKIRRDHVYTEKKTVHVEDHVSDRSSAGGLGSRHWYFYDSGGSTIRYLNGFYFLGADTVTDNEANLLGAGATDTLTMMTYGDHYNPWSGPRLTIGPVYNHSLSPNKFGQQYWNKRRRFINITPSQRISLLSFRFSSSAIRLRSNRFWFDEQLNLNQANNQDRTFTSIIIFQIKFGNRNHVMLGPSSPTIKLFII